MNDIQRLKYDLSLRYASAMIQNDIVSNSVNASDIILIRNKMISYAMDFAESLNDGTMCDSVLPDLLKKII